MNIHQVLMSGKRFRRPGKDNFGQPRQYYSDFNNFMQNTLGEHSFHGFPYEEWMRADDWEVEETVVELTATKFWDAYSSAITAAANDQGMLQLSNIVQHMATKLGVM